MKKQMFVAGCALLLISTWAVAAPPDHANGSPPEKFYMVDFGGPFTERVDFIDCGDFETDIEFTFGGFWITHPENAKKGLWEFYHSDWPVTIYNAEDDDLFVEGIPGQVMNRHWTGEPFASVQIETGVQLMVVLPGYGVIHRNVGKAIIDGVTDPENPVFIFTAGHWDFADGDFQALCAALSP